MGIQNIEILINPDVRIQTASDRKVVDAYLLALVKSHHRGEHPYGSMRRDCPLCQSA